MLGDTQNQHNKKRTENEKDTDNINKLITADKRRKEREQHELWDRQDKKEIDFTNAHDFMTENPQTEVSMLAAHRVKPYHFKGFNENQIKDVYDQRSN